MAALWQWGDRSPTLVVPCTSLVLCYYGLACLRRIGLSLHWSGGSSQWDFALALPNNPLGSTGRCLWGSHLRWRRWCGGRLRCPVLLWLWGGFSGSVCHAAGLQPSRWSVFVDWSGGDLVCSLRMRPRVRSRSLGSSLQPASVERLGDVCDLSRGGQARRLSAVELPGLCTMDSCDCLSVPFACTLHLSSTSSLSGFELSVSPSGETRGHGLGGHRWVDRKLGCPRRDSDCRSWSRGSCPRSCPRSRPRTQRWIWSWSWS